MFLITLTKDNSLDVEIACVKMVKTRVITFTRKDAIKFEQFRSQVTRECEEVAPEKSLCTDVLVDIMLVAKYTGRAGLHIEKTRQRGIESYMVLTSYYSDPKQMIMDGTHAVCYWSKHNKMKDLRSLQQVERLSEVKVRVSAV